MLGSLLPSSPVLAPVQCYPYGSRTPPPPLRAIRLLVALALALAAQAVAAASEVVAAAPTPSLAATSWVSPSRPLDRDRPMEPQASARLRTPIPTVRSAAVVLLAVLRLACLPPGSHQGPLAYDLGQQAVLLAAAVPVLLVRVLLRLVVLPVPVWGACLSRAFSPPPSTGRWSIEGPPPSLAPAPAAALALALGTSRSRAHPLPRQAPRQLVPTRPPPAKAAPQHPRRDPPPVHCHRRSPSPLTPTAALRAATRSSGCSKQRMPLQPTTPVAPQQ